MPEHEPSDFERAVLRAAVIGKVARIYRWRRLRGFIPIHGRLLR